MKKGSFLKSNVYHIIALRSYICHPIAPLDNYIMGCLLVKDIEDSVEGSCDCRNVPSYREGMLTRYNNPRMS